MSLQSLFYRYRDAYVEKYGHITTPNQWSAQKAIIGCRTEQYGAVSATCQDCDWQQLQFISCGHRSCTQCHHHSNIQWCERQSRKLTTVRYFLVTFTPPSELHGLARHHPAVVYDLMFKASIETLRRFD